MTDTETKGSAASNVNALIDEVHHRLDAIESAAEQAGQIRGAVRTAKRLQESLEGLTTDLGITFDLSTLEQVGRLEAYLPTDDPDLADKVSMVAKALDASEILPDIPADDCREVLERHALVMKAAKSSAKPGKTRGIGAEITVACDCGDFVRTSSGGDWTSIRYQAKKHAEECSQANPYDEFINDLDDVRRSIVDRRENIRSGGLRFTVEGGHHTVQAESPSVS
jgi:hypothetical protein